MTFGLHGRGRSPRSSSSPEPSPSRSCSCRWMRPLSSALIWGLSLLAVLGYALARAQRVPPWKVIGEHVLIGLSVGDHPLSRSVGAGDVRIRVADEGDTGGVEIQTQLPKVRVGRRCGAMQANLGRLSKSPQRSDG